MVFVTSLTILSRLPGGKFGHSLQKNMTSWHDGQRWCFWINLPFGAIALATVFFFFENPARKESDLTIKQKLAKIDLLGAFFLICAICCLLLALQVCLTLSDSVETKRTNKSPQIQWGGSKYAWSDSKVYGLIIGFGLIIALFIGIQFYRGEDATLPPRIMGQRTVLASSLFSCFLAMAIYTSVPMKFYQLIFE